MALNTLSISGYPADEDGEAVDLCYLDSEKQPQGYFKSQNDAFLQVIYSTSFPPTLGLALAGNDTVGHATPAYARKLGYFFFSMTLNRGRVT